MQGAELLSALWQLDNYVGIIPQAEAHSDMRRSSKLEDPRHS